MEVLTMKSFLPIFAAQAAADRARFELFLNVFVRCPEPAPRRRAARKH
jgi:hypothetical protein